jgi:hypothetical protein
MVISPSSSNDPFSSPPLPLIEGTTSINYERLYKEEKRRIRNERKQKKPSSTEVNGSSNAFPGVEVSEQETIITPPWNYDDSLLISTPPPPLLPLTCPKLGNQCLFYQQNFLPPSFHDALYLWLLHELPERPYDKSNNQNPSGAYWTTLPHAQRRVALCELPFPQPLQQLVHYLERSEAHSPLTPEINHILLNHYPSSAHGILPHTDGPAYAPYTITVSLGPGDVLLHFTANTLDEANVKEAQQLASVLLHGRGSCIRFQDDAYSKAQHAIAIGVSEEVTTADCCNTPAGQCVVRQTHRISITLRHYYSNCPGPG